MRNAPQRRTLYIGRDWSYRRLRDTCAVAWLNARLPLEHVRRLLGLASLEATLPYASLATRDGHSRTAHETDRGELFGRSGGVAHCK